MKPTKPKNRKTYRARFAGLRIRAFGIEQTLTGDLELEIYQARVSPELWLVRPEARHFPDWRARSAEELMANIPEWFEMQLSPWTEETHAAPLPRPREKLRTPLQPESGSIQ